MGKGNRRGGRARAGARHQQHHRRGHFHHRTIGMARGSRTGHFVFGIWLFVFASFLTIAGIALTVVYSTNYNSYYHLIMVAAGVLLLVVAVFMCARAKRKSGTGAATSPAGQDTGATAQPGPQHTATSGTSLQPTETGAPGAMSTSETIPGQPMATSGLSHPSAGQPYPGSQPCPGSQPYPGPAAAAGFGAAPSAPPTAQPPPQYGFSYNTADNYNTQYSAGTSDLPPPPAYSTVVNEKL